MLFPWAQKQWQLGMSQSHPVLHAKETDRQRKLHNGRVVPKHPQTPHATVPPIKKALYYIPECIASTIAMKVRGKCTCIIVLLQLICPWWRSTVLSHMYPDSSVLMAMTLFWTKQWNRNVFALSKFLRLTALYPWAARVHLSRFL